MLSFAIQLAAIGAVESVLTLQACNEITDTVPKISDSNQECFAQGLANLVCGLFRGKLVLDVQGSLLRCIFVLHAWSAHPNCFTT
jgi:MFS superfamily sulfate permease-like transporter